MYQYRIVIKRIVDSDTLIADIDLGFRNWMLNKEIRLFGYDGPESRTADEKEKALGLYAKHLVSDYFAIGSEYILISHKDETGKYGRILGEIVYDFAGTEITRWSELLTSNGLAWDYENRDKEAETAYWHQKYEEMLSDGLLIPVTS